MTLGRRTFVMVLLGAAVAVGSVGDPRPTAAVEVGQAAPDFTLPSTTGPDISLSEFKGKQWVFLEFYGSDFAPT